MKNKKINESNFNLILFDSNSEQKNKLIFLDTVYCDKHLNCGFNIGIIYSVFAKRKISSVKLRLFLRYLPQKGEKSVYQEVINDTIFFGKSNEFTKNNNLKSITETYSNMPSDIIIQETGRYIIHYSTQMYSFGNYQLELYYQFDEENDYSLATVLPFEVKNKKGEDTVSYGQL